MTRLDALKARLAVVLAEDKEGVAVSPECPYSDAELDLLDHAREDIERLVAVVETAQALTKIPESEMSLRDFKEDRLMDALAYWLEPEEQG